MSGNRFEQTLEFSLQPSHWAFAIIAGLHGLVAVVALLVPAFPFWVRLLMAAIVGLSAFRALKLRYWQTAPQTVKALRWLESGEWQVQTNTYPQWQTVQLAKHSFANRRIMILNFKHPEQGFLNAWVLPDSVLPEQFQSLRMRWSQLN